MWGFGVSIRGSLSGPITTLPFLSFSATTLQRLWHKIQSPLWRQPTIVESKLRGRSWTRKRPGRPRQQQLPHMVRRAQCTASAIASKNPPTRLCLKWGFWLDGENCQKQYPVWKCPHSTPSHTRSRIQRSSMQSQHQYWLPIETPHSIFSLDHQRDSWPKTFG